MISFDRRDMIVAEARSWVGTPYHHMGAERGRGVDCLMLLVRVYAALGMIRPIDPRPYPRTWHLHRSEERYLAGVLDHAVEVSVPEPGDVVLWRVGRTFSHAGIVSGWPRVVHAYARARIVEESDVSAVAELADARRERRYFRVSAGVKGGDA
jgi:NlpC/P60 family putative phage cell wall peptidase